MFFQKWWGSGSAGRPSVALLILGLLLLVTFAFGGSARGDELGIIVLRPGSVVALALSLYLVKAEHIRKHRFWTWWLASIVALTLLHLIPLPPALWHLLPGRELAVELDALMGSSALWRPISLSPELTRNALWSLTTPLACYFLMIQLSRQDIVRVLLLVIVLGVVSGLISVIQISQGPGSIAYFYRITNFGQGVGLFANRNHQAVLLVCLMPIGFGLATIAMKVDVGLNRAAASVVAQWGLGLGAIFVFILVMVTGSRAGLVLYLVAMIQVFGFARKKGYFSRKSTEAAKHRTVAGKLFHDARLWFLLLPVAMVTGALVSGRDVAFQRLTDTSSEIEPRIRIADTLYRAISAYFPVGSGIGTFDPVFRIHEGSDLLAPRYWNHAHNDWAELLMTGGVPAVAIVAAALWWFLKFIVFNKNQKSQRPEIEAFQFVGACVLVLVALSSIVEYPLRVPILSCLFVISIVLVSRARETASR